MPAKYQRVRTLKRHFFGRKWKQAIAWKSIKLTSFVVLLEALKKKVEAFASKYTRAYASEVIPAINFVGYECAGSFEIIYLHLLN